MIALKQVVVTDTVQSPGKSACGFVWDGNIFWYYDLAVHTLFQVSTSGEELRSIKTGASTSGIAFDGTNNNFVKLEIE